MTRDRLKTTMQMMKRMLMRGAERLREKTAGRPTGDRMIAVEFETAHSAVVPVTVLA